MRAHRPARAQTCTHTDPRMQTCAHTDPRRQTCAHTREGWREKPGCERLSYGVAGYLPDSPWVRNLDFIGLRSGCFPRRALALPCSGQGAPRFRPDPLDSVRFKENTTQEWLMICHCGSPVGAPVCVGLGLGVRRVGLLPWAPGLLGLPCRPPSGCPCGAPALPRRPWMAVTPW